MKNMKPKLISQEEWRDIIAVPAVREAWGLADDVTPSEFAGSVYAAKFDFVSGSPGYVGDLYILQGDALTGYPPIVLRRADDNALVVCVEDNDKLSNALSKYIADLDRTLDDPRSVHEGELWEKFVGLRNRMEALRVELNTTLEDAFDWDRIFNSRGDR
jgi:hypothetical protein